MNYNDIDKNILMKHLELACFEDIEKKYSHQNYSVYREYKISEHLRADIVAIKDDEMIIFEIKCGEMYQAQKDKLYEIKNYVEKHNKNVKFKMIFLNYPQAQSIEFENLSEIIFDDIFTNGIPSELDVLSTHTRIEEVTDLEIDAISIKDECIFIHGNGIIEVSLQYGSDSEQEADDDYCTDFPFEFKIQLNKNYNIEDAEYEFETDSYYR